MKGKVNRGTTTFQRYSHILLIQQIFQLYNRQNQDISQINFVFYIDAASIIDLTWEKTALNAGKTDHDVIFRCGHSTNSQLTSVSCESSE